MTQQTLESLTMLDVLDGVSQEGLNPDTDVGCPPPPGRTDASPGRLAPGTSSSSGLSSAPRLSGVLPPIGSRRFPPCAPDPRPDVRLVILNGPPGCGKDAAAQALTQYLEARSLKFADPLREAIPVLFGLSRGTWGFIYGDRRLKDEPTWMLKGMSPRQAMIWLSEEVMKPKFGQRFFGEAAVERIADMAFAHVKPTPLVVVGDCGFAEELDPLIEAFGVEQMLLVRVFRPGCTYDSDSRRYIQAHDLPADLLSVDLYNTGDLESFRANVVSTVLSWSRAVVAA